MGNNNHRYDYHVETENLEAETNSQYQPERKMKRRSLILLGVFILGVGVTFWAKVFDWFLKMLP